MSTQIYYMEQTGSFTFNFMVKVRIILGQYKLLDNV
jgi:hypothetical protein